MTLSETVGYVKNPSLKDKIHCVAFVVNASKIQTYPKSISSTFQQLREHIRDLGMKSTNNQMPRFSHTVQFVSLNHIIPATVEEL